MAQSNRQPLHLSFSEILPVLLLVLGWYGVVIQSRNLEASTIETYQKAQLEVVRNAARAAQAYITRELERRPQAVHEIEQEVLDYFVKPIRIGSVGDAWIYSPEYVVFDASEDFPAEYRGKSMAEIFALQRRYGARHYEKMTASVMQGQEGTGWYVWQPDKARESTPWWEFLTHDAGREIAAWSPVVVFPNTERQKTWVIGMSAMLPELMQSNGSYALIQASIITMSGMSVITVGLLLLLLHSKAALQKSEAYYRAIVEHQTDLICRFRPDGTLTFVNQAYATTFGSQPEALLGANVLDLIAEAERPAVWFQIASLNADHPVSVHERLVMTPTYGQRWQQWTDRAILNERGQVVEIQSVGRDITDRKLYEAEIERLAFTDPLTGLANRRRLYDIGHRLLTKHGSNHASDTASDAPALLYLDLDRFKPINDTLGHDAGDELLMQVAERLRACIRKGDTLARFGGDEFAILLHRSEAREAQVIAERILTTLHQPFHLRGRILHVGGSLGIATARSASCFSQLLTQADIAMYRAKAQGRGHYAIFDAAMYAEASTRLELETDLRQILEQQELRVHYQPIISLTSQQILGFEALVRWHHPRRGLLAPGEFLAIAGELGLELAIERWVLREACRQMAFWQTRQLTQSPLLISANLSGKHLMQPDLIDYIARLLRETTLDPKTLLLEITEDAFIQQTDSAVATLIQLRQLGVQISLDDFGTGYSSLSYLHRFPVDILKIDRSFIQDMSVGDENSEIVRTIVMLAHSLGMQTVAEGIETLDQLSQLKALQCTYGQGFLFSQPLSERATEELLQVYQQNAERFLKYQSMESAESA